MRFVKRNMFFVVILLLTLSLTFSASAKEKVILDTDMGQFGDDAYCLFMLANSDKVDLLGVTVDVGNVWMQEGVAYTLSNLEVLGRTDIPVFFTAEEPLMGTRQSWLEADAKVYGAAGYKGAYSRPVPESYLDLGLDRNGNQRVPYGGYSEVEPQAGAVEFIYEQVKKYPNEITLFVIGATTNIALLVREHPDVVPLIKSVIYMGGSFDIPGNTTPAGEFNWWFDPEAARITIRTPFKEQIVVPLDVCEKYLYGKEQYDRIVAGEETPLVKMFKDKHGPRFEASPDRKSYIWDSITAAIFINPGIATEIVESYADVDDSWGPNYGRSMRYSEGRQPDGTQLVKILFSIDEEAFWDLFVNLAQK